MIQFIRRFIDDFRITRMIRKNLDVLDPKQNEDEIRYIVNRYSEDKEHTINSLLLHSLTRELVRWQVSPEMYNWYVMALEHRIMLFQNNRKLLNKQK